MDLLKDNVKKIYFRYLTASFGSAMIVAVYSIVDCAVVGQYEGALGVAALATVAPVWNLIYSLGLLFGIGGAVLMSTARGTGNRQKGDSYFTCALIGVSVTALLVWFFLCQWETPMLALFGADASLLPLASSYLAPIRFVIPLYLFGQFLAAFLRNDGAPGKATAAVLSGGIFNVVFDIFFVFVCDFGIFGAGLATALGQVLSVLIMLTHFMNKKCTLRLISPLQKGILSFFRDMRQIITTGFSTFFIDIAMGGLSLMFNNQIMHYLGAAALAVYGVIININILVQSCAYGIGQAAQPLISVNFGAGNKTRVRQTLLYSLLSTAVISVIWTILTMSFPTALTNFFMKPSAEVLQIAPDIMRRYFISFLLLPLNIFSTYYFQAVLKPLVSFSLSVLRGLLLSGALIFLLPFSFGADALWLAMPLTELVVGILAIVLMAKSNKELGRSL